MPGHYYFAIAIGVSGYPFHLQNLTFTSKNSSWQR